MAQCRELPRPVVAAGAGFHANQAGLEPAEERRHLRAANLPAQHHIATAVHAVNLEHALCHVDSTRCNLHDGLPLARVLDMTNFQSGTSRCRTAMAGVHTIALEPTAASGLRSLAVPSSLRSSASAQRGR